MSRISTAGRAVMNITHQKQRNGVRSQSAASRADPYVQIAIKKRRKLEPGDEHHERVKARKLATMAPRELNDPSMYEMRQRSQGEMILSHYLAADAVILLLSLLYCGSGHFSDSMAALTVTFSTAIHAGTFYNPDCVIVDRLMNAMCGIDSAHEKREKEGHRLLEILFPDSLVWFKSDRDDQSQGCDDELST
jgi:hypothetical protein